MSSNLQGILNFLSVLGLKIQIQQNTLLLNLVTNVQVSMVVLVVQMKLGTSQLGLIALPMVK